MDAASDPDVGHRGGASVVVATSKDAGATLSVRWTAFPDLVGKSGAPSTASCATATIVISTTVQGGPASAGDFDFTISGLSPNPPATTRETTQVKTDVATTVQAGLYVAAEALSDLPGGYVWMSTTCEDLTTADPASPGLTVFVAPGDTITCQVVDHYGPLLTDTIAPGVNKGVTGFGIASLVVSSRSYITYLVRTNPNLAGKHVQIWTRSESGSWVLTTTRTVAGDGTLHYYARVAAWTAFLGKWAGDTSYVTAGSHGRIATVKTGTSTTPAPPTTVAGLPGEPDRRLTPGALNPAVTPATIGATICVSGWTATVRPSSSYTTALKIQQIAQYGYTDTSTSSYEEDHLIPLELGGAPADVRNLWPEPYSIALSDGTAVGARVKDTFESQLKRQVCAGSLTLSQAQTEIGIHWVHYWLGLPAGTGTSGSTSPTPTPTRKPTPTPKPAPGANGNPCGYNFSPGSLIYNPPSSLCSYFSCIPSFWQSTSGYVIECVDGMLSHSGGRTGVCSSHGGPWRPLYSH